MSFGTSGKVTVTPQNDALVYTAVPQADGKILIGGTFKGVTTAATSRLRAARLSSAGVLDSFNPEPGANDVRAFNVQPDGKIYMAGWFTAVNNTPRKGVARVNESGTLDTGFAVPTDFNWTPNTIVEHNEGFIVGGEGGFVKLSTTGAYAPAFPQVASTSIRNVLVQPDLKFVASGLHSTVSPPYYRRYTSAGAAEGTGSTGFAVQTLNQTLHAAALQNDGKVILAGEFTTVVTTTNTTLQRTGLIRVQANGALETAFNPTINGSVFAVVLQTDGKILIGGDFTSPRNGIARLNTNGTVDTTFDAKLVAGSSVTGISQQEDGKILITGTFLPPGQTGQTWRIARLANDSTGRSYLRTPSATEVEWIRSGSVPELKSVFFEYSFDGSFWSPIGFGQGARFNDGVRQGWRITTTIPLTTGFQIRAQGKTTGGRYSGSSGMIARTSTFPIPEISLLNQSGTAVYTGGAVTTYAETTVPTDITLTVRNSGTGNLTGLTTSLTGTHASLFSVVTPPTAPVAGPSGTTPLVLRFSPTTSGAKTAALTITSNDPTTPSFTVNLTGNVVTPIEAFRYRNFLVLTNTGNAADSADPDGDGQTNFFEFVAGLIPTDPASRFEQRVDRSSGTPQVIFSPRLADRTYEVQTSATLDGNWPEALGTTSDVGNERTFTHTGVTDDKRFYRVKITK